jgi:hypothetical protein
MCLLCKKDKQTKKTYKTTFDAILYPYLVSGDGVTCNVESGGGTAHATYWSTWPVQESIVKYLINSQKLNSIYLKLFFYYSMKVENRDMN